MYRRMNKIIRLLENEDFQSVRSLIECDKRFNKAFKVLEDQGVIEVLYADGEPHYFALNDCKSASYSLSRHDVWANRIIGFIAGVATTFVCALITQLLTGSPG